MPGFPTHHQLPKLLKLMSIELVVPSNHLLLCLPLLLLLCNRIHTRIYSIIYSWVNSIIKVLGIQNSDKEALRLPTRIEEIKLFDSSWSVVTSQRDKRVDTVWPRKAHRKFSTLAPSFVPLCIASELQVSSNCESEMKPYISPSDN